MIVEEHGEHLFVSFKVKDQAYALRAYNVDSIFERREDLIPVPKTSDCLLGLISIRGGDFACSGSAAIAENGIAGRGTGGIRPNAAGAEAGSHSLGEQLRNSVETGAPFMLAVDPHECAFGKWYENYKAPNHAVTVAMAGIEAPHRLIHHSAEDCFACRGDRKKQRRIIETIIIPAMNGVLKGIDQMIAEFTSTKRNLCIAVSEQDMRFGIAVDEVLSVEPLENTQPIGAVGEDELFLVVPCPGRRGEFSCWTAGKFLKYFTRRRRLMLRRKLYANKNRLSNIYFLIGKRRLFTEIR